jgi:hypothetical protein
MRSKMWSTAAIACMFVSLTAAQEKKDPARDKGRGGEDIVTVLGCVQKESDYRAQKNDGRGGAANTGLGVANEFMLRGAKTVNAETLKPIDTGGSNIDSYSLTGRLEGDVQPAVGQQIAVTGYVEKATSEGTNKVKDLPMLNVLSWRKVSDRCQ